MSEDHNPFNEFDIDETELNTFLREQDNDELPELVSSDNEKVQPEQFDFTKPYNREEWTINNSYHHIKSYEEITALYHKNSNEMEEVKERMKQEWKLEQVRKFQGRIEMLSHNGIMLYERRNELLQEKLHYEMIERKDQILGLVNLIQRFLREFYQTDLINVYPLLCNNDYTEDCGVPEGTFQFTLNIHSGYKNEQSVENHPIISGTDYPYVLSCVTNSKEEKEYVRANLIIQTEKDWKKYVHHLPNMLPTDMQNHLALRMNELYLENEELKSRLGGEYALMAQQSFEEKLSPKDEELIAKQKEFLDSSDKLEQIILSLEEEQRKLYKYENIHFQIEPTTLIMRDVPDLRYKITITQDNENESILLAEKILLIVKDNGFALKRSSDEEIPIIQGRCGKCLIKTPTPELWEAYWK